MFKIFDKDQDGQVTRHDIGAVTRSLGLHLSSDDLDCFMKSAGKERNGHFNLQEFSEMLLKY